MSNNARIEIVSSSLKALSSMSYRSRHDIKQVLLKHFSHVEITLINNIADLDRLVERKPDLIFLGMKSLPANDSDPVLWIADYLDRYNIRYTGSISSAHELELNKPLAKQRVASVGLATTPYKVIKENQLFNAQDISLIYPLFVKPTNRGGGAGIDEKSLVYDYDHLVLKVASINSKLNSESLIEEYLPGREFSVAILDDDKNCGVSIMPIELRAEVNSSGERVLSHDVKISNTEEVLSLEDGQLKSKIIDFAKKSFDALGARDYGRIDIRLDTNGDPHFLEANLIPSLIGGYGSFPKACSLNENMSYETMILRIVNLALTRSTKQDFATQTPVLAY